MNGWESHELGNCLQLLSGGTPSKSKNEYWGGDIPWVSCKDMKVDRIYDSVDHLTPLGASNGTRLVPENTILFVVRGMILAKEFPVALTKRSVAFNQDLKAAIPSKLIDTGFLFHWFRANSYEVLGRVDEAGHGTKRLQTDRLLSMQIHVPLISTQKRIAAILSAYDELIENNQRRIRILEEMARSLYREWFVHFRYPGHDNSAGEPNWTGEGRPEGESAKDGTNQNVPMVGPPLSPLSPIPQRWEVKPLGKVLNIRKGKNITKKTIVPGDVPVVAGGITPAYYHNTANTKHPVITISASGANAGFVNLYEENVWASDCSFVDFDATPHVYYYYLQFINRQKEITHLQRGSAQPHVYPKDLMALDTIIPPVDLLDQFRGRVGSIFHLMKALSSKNKNLSQTRDLLLPKLLSGQVALEAAEQ